MSSYDITFCATDCDRQDCRRNLKYQNPFISVPYVSMSMFDDKCEDKNHKDCEEFWKES